MTTVAPRVTRPEIGPVLDFVLPAELAASEPPEIRGSGRDDVRLLVSWRAGCLLGHARFAELPELLEPGDLLVVNTSATLPAAVDGRLSGPPEDGAAIELHFSTRLPAGLHVVELRRPDGNSTRPWLDAPSGLTVWLPDGGQVETLVPMARSQTRLWVASVRLPLGFEEYLAVHGRPIRYGYVPHDRPIGDYQTIFATEPGSAEMPSAARPFTPELVTRLVSRGVGVAPLVLHAGVSSGEAHEPPFPEYYRVPASTARQVETARAGGGRVVAVGTTVVRALRRPGRWTRRSGSRARRQPIAVFADSSLL